MSFQAKRGICACATILDSSLRYATFRMTECEHYLDTLHSRHVFPQSALPPRTFRASKLRPPGQSIRKSYGFGANFYVNFTLTPYRKVHHPMRGGERWSCSTYRDAPVEAPAGWPLPPGGGVPTRRRRRRRKEARIEHPRPVRGTRR